jgi:uncharacterized protein
VSDPDVGNRADGGRAHDALEFWVHELVSDQDSVEIETSQWRQRLNLRLSVAPDEMGKVIGKKGRTATALRTVVRAVGSHDGSDVFVDIVD